MTAEVAWSSPALSASTPPEASGPSWAGSWPPPVWVDVPSDATAGWPGVPPIEAPYADELDTGSPLAVEVVTTSTAVAATAMPVTPALNVVRMVFLRVLIADR